MGDARRKVFISHSGSFDASPLASALEQAGVEPLRTETSLKPGDPVVAQIDTLLQQADGAVVVIECKSSPSPGQQREWEAALESSWSHPAKRLIPVVEEGADVPAFLRSYQWVKLPREGGPERWRAAANEINKALTGATDPKLEEGFREAARTEWRERLRSLEAVVKPLADAERTRE